MRNHFFTFLILLMTSCSHNDSNVFDSDNLRGKYRVDLTPAIKKAVKEKEGDDGWDKLGKGLAAMILSSIDIEMSFYDDNKGIIHFGGGPIDFAASMSEEEVPKIKKFEYKIEDDSVLYFKYKDTGKFRKWGYIKKFSSSYDYIRFLRVEEGEKPAYFDLNKVSE